QPALDRGLHHAPRLGDHRGGVMPAQRLTVEAVVVGFEPRSLAVDHQDMRARQRRDMAIDGRRLRYPEKGREVPDRLPVQLQIEAGKALERGDLGGEDHRAGAWLRVVERLLAGDVTRQYQLPLGYAPQRRREHAVE